MRKQMMLMVVLLGLLSGSSANADVATDAPDAVAINKLDQRDAALAYADYLQSAPDRTCSLQPADYVTNPHFKVDTPGDDTHVPALQVGVAAAQCTSQQVVNNSYTLTVQIRFEYFSKALNRYVADGTPTSCSQGAVGGQAAVECHKVQTSTTNLNLWHRATITITSPPCACTAYSETVPTLEGGNIP